VRPLTSTAGKIGGLGDEKMNQCVLDAIKKWKFPEPNIPSPVYVDHTFTFKKTVPEDAKSGQTVLHVKKQVFLQ